MRHFLKNILFFIFPLLIITFPLDLIISYQLTKSKTYAYGEYSVWNDLYSGKINSEIVVYGSSRAWVHIDPQMIEDSLGLSSYNLGINGHNFWLQYLRHKTLLKYNKKPKYIILAVDIYTLQKREDLYNLDQFLPYMLFNQDIITFTSSFPGYSRFDYYLPLIRYFGRTKAIKQSIKNTLYSSNSELGRKKGFQGMEKEWNDDLVKAQKRMSYYDVKLNDSSIKLFENFLDECKENDIKVIFVYTPEYIEGQSFIKNRKEIISLFENFANRHEILFFDYSSDELCLKKEYFYNASHLNKTGAKIFTNKLIRDLKIANIDISLNR